jgi:hypothetical protein
MEQFIKNNFDYFSSGTYFWPINKESKWNGLSEARFTYNTNDRRLSYYPASNTNVVYLHNFSIKLLYILGYRK